MYYINASTDITEYDLYTTCRGVMENSGTSKLYLTAQKYQLGSDETFVIDEPYNGSYYLLQDVYGFNPIFGVTITSDTSFEEFKDIVSLMPIWEDDSTYYIYFINPDIAGISKEIYSTRWGDYHELFTEYCNNSYLNLDNINDSINLATYYYANTDNLELMRNVEEYLVTPRTWDTQPDMVILGELNSYSTIAVMEV